MKAISIHRPWASLIARGEEHYETRNRKPQPAAPSSSTHPNPSAKPSKPCSARTPQNPFYPATTSSQPRSHPLAVPSPLAAAGLVPAGRRLNGYRPSQEKTQDPPPPLPR